MLSLRHVAPVRSVPLCVLTDEWLKGPQRSLGLPGLVGSFPPRALREVLDQERHEVRPDGAEVDDVALGIVGPVLQAGVAVVLNDAAILVEFFGDGIPDGHQAAPAAPEVEEDAVDGVPGLRDVDGPRRRPVRLGEDGPAREPGRGRRHAGYQETCDQDNCGSAMAAHRVCSCRWCPGLSADC